MQDVLHFGIKKHVNGFTHFRQSYYELNIVPGLLYWTASDCAGMSNKVATDCTSTYNNILCWY